MTMPTIDTTKLEQLLTEEKWDEAKKILDQYFQGDLTPEQRGGAYVQLASIYLQVNNRLNRQYEQTLDDALAVLKSINTSEAVAKDTAAVDDAKRQIEKI